MQQQLIDGFIIDHLESTSSRPAKGGAPTSLHHVTYDACGRKVITLAAESGGKKPSTRVVHSPRRGKHPIVLPSHAKRLMQSACADLRLVDIDEDRSPRRLIHTAPSPRSSRSDAASRSPRPMSVHGSSRRDQQVDQPPPVFPAIPTSPQSSPRHRRVLRSEAVLDETLQSPLKPPLDAWGIPRQHILEFIRLSVLPCTWATNIKSMGEWRAADDNGADDSRPHASHPRHNATNGGQSPGKDLKHSPMGQVHLPTLADARDHHQQQQQHDSTGRNDGGASRKPPPPALYKKAARPTASPALPVITSRDMTVETRIHNMIVDLQHDPRAWDEFQRRIKEFQDQKKKGTEIDIVHENKANAFAVTPPEYYHERSRQRQAQHIQTMAKYKAQLEMEHERRIDQLDRRAQKLKEQRRRLACQSQGRLWLQVIVAVVIATTWRRRMEVEKSRKSIEFRQITAVCLIQRVWRRKVHLSNSKAMLQIILKTRQILWSLTFKILCKKKAKAGSVLRRFLVDYFNGSSETGNFRVMMARWRWRVIHAQRASKAFLNCSRARMTALSLLWDNADRERQRTEKLHLQQSKTVVVMPGNSQAADATENGHLSITRRILRVGIQEESLTEMEQQLSLMQTMLTPIEFQRMQHHAYHVVRIPKSIKVKLLTQYLAAKRADNIRAVQEYFAHVLSNTSSRQVQVNDARTIVQNGAWGTLMGGPTGILDPKAKLGYPVFTLYSKNTSEEIRKLIQEGIALTLEQDPEQRRLVETQRQGASVAAEGAPSSRRLSVFAMPGAGSRRNGKDAAMAKLFEHKKLQV
ncbi:hypothetical protein H310_10168 [Aphanomyces invadans]|uniref:Uncharacterized protein n=1 Tax=Aphanomyces invadans TaxID=157072 RepID=A0A024TUC3_9STRA|nr:hypothetical protein H310_10168 [Aphanomyces invadans]ETV96892.1 hypothetical protein H310_10168 [Aphanomyces invadans]|eukprot:XP_008874669.1 hypothetical protein H310_10168 [Aphanomyces invadans]